MSTSKLETNTIDTWAFNEFSKANLGDQRLNTRLIKMANSLAKVTESSLNTVFRRAADAKAAYRFFANKNVPAKEIL